MTTPRLRPSYDVIVVGARAAGASTALLLARAGFDVLVVDRSRYGADTLSTHALMRAGGLRAYRAALPFFLGLILGEFAIAAIWIIFDALTGIVGHSVFP